MGMYLNPTNNRFKISKSKKIYVDKSLLINEIYQHAVDTNEFICVARPRRFGKSTDAYMLVAYFSKGCDSSSLFEDLKIAQTDIYKKHLNKHNVIFINMQYFYDISSSVEDMIDFLNEELIDEINQNYHISIRKSKVSLLLNKIYAQTEEKFIFIIDEWDCILRNIDASEDDKNKFLVFMNELLKDKDYVELAYMTGILPIKKYGDQSAINMFDEISMIEPSFLKHYMGFTEKEVQELCNQYHMDFNMMKSWYDGYHLKNDVSIYSPRSIVKALTEREYNNYWSNTGTFGTLKDYIGMNKDGLKDTIIDLLAGKQITVDTSSFQNDVSLFNSKDDVLTLLIHLGYLGYNGAKQEVYIPNKEVIDSFVQSIKQMNWGQPTYAFNNSIELLNATWNLNEEKVAEYIEEAHLETSIIQYNDENALAYTIYFAYIAANKYYTIIRQLPTGNGFADIGFIPYDPTYPALLVELKWNKDVDGAIQQIIDRKYPKVLEHYKNNILLVGISYEDNSKNKNYKHHTCKIIKA